MKNKKPIKKIVLAIFLSLLTIFILLHVLPQQGYEGTTNFMKEPNTAPLVIAHGGAKILFPENTVMAFEESYKMGVDVLEADLCLTKDNQLITHHNMTVDATSNGTGLVRDFSLEEINELNFGHKFVDMNANMPYADETSPEILQNLVPMTVKEMFSTYGDSTRYILEIKDSGEDGIIAAEELNRLINEYSLQEYVCVASFHKEVMEYFKSIKHEDVNITTDFDTAFNFIASGIFGLDRFLEHDYAGFHLPSGYGAIPLDNNFIISLAKDNNMFLHYWTINDKEEMRQLILLGCDGIMTDRPDLMLEVLDELGY